MPMDMYGQPQVQGNGGSFAQKQQMKANPMMRGRPAMSGVMQKPNTQGAAIGAANTMNNYMRPNPMTGARPGLNAMNANAGMQGSRAQLQAKAQAQKQQGLGPSVDPVQQLQQSLQKQKGLQTPYDQQMMEQKQAQLQAATNPMQAAQEQMRDYEGPDLGSQDPRELARMGQLSGSVGQPMLENAPFMGTEQSAGPGMQNLMQEMGRGIGPSAQLFGGQPMDRMTQQPVVMDENGLEPRRGAR